jgi:hypothetical protein
LRDVTDPACDEWVEFDASSEAYPILGGYGHVDRIYAPQPSDGNAFEGFTLRLFDRASGLWRIWWSSTRVPGVSIRPWKAALRTVMESLSAKTRSAVGVSSFDSSGWSPNLRSHGGSSRFLRRRR